MPIEIERTYLADKIPAWIDRTTFTRIEDIYFPARLDLHPKLRLRSKGGLYEITKKTVLHDGDASQQVETTINLSETEYQELCQNSHRKVVKRRHSLEAADFLVEFDIFEGDLEGLFLVDFEFPDDSAMKSFVAPDYCGVDVTQEDFIAGGMLAGKSLDDIRNNLEQLSYSFPSIESQ